MKRKHAIYITVYGLVTLVLPFLYFIDFIGYRTQQRVGVDPIIPWPVLQTFDLLWVACLALTGAMRVPEPPIQITRRILEFDEEYEVDEDASLLMRSGKPPPGIRMVS